MVNYFGGKRYTDSLGEYFPQQEKIKNDVLDFILNQPNKKAGHSEIMTRMLSYPPEVLSAALDMLIEDKKISIKTPPAKEKETIYSVIK